LSQIHSGSSLRSVVRRIGWAEAGVGGLFVLLLGFGLANEAEDFYLLPIAIVIVVAPPAIVAMLAGRFRSRVSLYATLVLLLLWPFLVWQII